ncbi:hypothetical protein F5B22DRAFT_644840 [Xylaria bambusicola]|uniref:uncharacterized protein n=1 Tax=Xylaria bambusicola TaxID=326684 RepID=UPI002007D441|nr:uncharacterized protein F5B22DRAFT_644840 [Xylaria bambusicola]KAI0518533.1 hypothetical protein F5B22DRAFT_644840 [Xylaria bambusicola]
MAQQFQPSVSSQTDSNASNTDTPGHEPLDAFRPPPTIGPHARQAVLPQDSTTQGPYDQDVCVCIACLTPFSNNATLRQHGKRECHRPYGCTCGDAFSRLDGLERHIASKNKVNRFPCPLCARDEAPKLFARADHLSQHLRTFHRIPAGKIPEEFNATTHHDDQSSTCPQSLPQYPCQVQGCLRAGELGFLRQIDLDEHMICVHPATQHDMITQQALINPAPSWMGNDLQHDFHSSQFGLNAQWNYLLQPDPVVNYDVEGNLLRGESRGGSIDLQSRGDFNNFSMDFSFGI